MPSRTSPHGRRSSSPSARRKALSGRTREGSACVAIGGLWNWQIRGRTIADLDRIDWYEREAVIVPDSDIWTRPDLLHPGCALDLLERAESVRVLHPAQDVLDSVLWYGLPVDSALVAITSARHAHRGDQLPEGIALRHTEPGPSTVSRELAVRWLTTGESGSIAKTLDPIADFFIRYVVLRDRRTALWIAAWALATWCYRAFRIFPYLSIRSAEKRCGKSRLLGLLARVCFNASPVTAHPTEAQLYRSAARTGGAQLFDEVETLRGDKDRFDALITVLNVGFERGGVVTRLEKRGERFVEEPYEVYAPRVLAGIAGLKDTLEDRALTLVMLRRRRGEAVARIGRP